MKKIILIISILVLATSTMNGQNRNRERIKLLKTSFITDALDLKPKEAEKFWPVYNLYMDKIAGLRFNLENGLQREIRQTGGFDTISEEQAQKFLKKIDSIEKQILENKMLMSKELSEIISAQKILKLHKAERDFNRRVLQEYGKKRKMQGR